MSNGPAVAGSLAVRENEISKENRYMRVSRDVPIVRPQATSRRCSKLHPALSSGRMATRQGSEPWQRRAPITSSPPHSRHCRIPMVMLLPRLVSFIRSQLSNVQAWEREQTQKH